jgi:enoyl-[acyl-carrier-protein] reductase (NADH)
VLERGWAIAERLAKEGANLFITDIDGKNVPDNSDRVRQMNRQTLVIQMDVASGEMWKGWWIRY